jgi:hypothetical protein
MSAVVGLLAKIREAGVSLVAEGDELVCDAAPGVLTPERVARIRKHKAALLAQLKAEAALAARNAYLREHRAEVLDFLRDPERTCREVRGACVHCGETVRWSDGLKNWFGQLTHHRCAGLWRARA